MRPPSHRRRSPAGMSANPASAIAWSASSVAATIRSRVSSLRVKPLCGVWRYRRSTKGSEDVCSFHRLRPDQKPDPFAWTGSRAGSEASDTRAKSIVGMLSGRPNSGIGLERLRLRNAATGKTRQCPPQAQSGVALSSNKAPPRKHSRFLLEIGEGETEQLGSSTAVLLWRCPSAN